MDDRIECTDLCTEMLDEEILWGTCAKVTRTRYVGTYRVLRSYIPILVSRCLCKNLLAASFVPQLHASL